MRIAFRLREPEPNRIPPKLSQTIRADSANQVDFARYSNEFHGYEISYPTGWEKREVSPEYVEFISPLSDSEDQVREQLGIYIYQPPSMPLNVFCTEMAESYVISLKAISTPTISQINVSGYDGYRISYLREIGNGVRVTIEESWIYRNDRLYLIIEVMSFRTFDPTMKRITNSMLSALYII